MPAEAPAQIMIRNRTLLDGLPASASPMLSVDKMTMPASSIAASISDAALAPFWARMNVYWASKLTYISPEPSTTRSQVANAMTRLPGVRPDPASRRMLVTARTQLYLRQGKAPEARTDQARDGRPRNAPPATPASPPHARDYSRWPWPCARSLSGLRFRGGLPVHPGQIRRFGLMAFG